MKEKIEFQGIKYKLEHFKYRSGRHGLTMLNENKNEWFSVTLDIFSVKINDNEVIIKNHDRNTGIIDCLIDNHIINKQIKPITLGTNKVYLCKLILKRWNY